MFAYIKGKYIESTDNCVIIEANGIGYEIFAPPSSIANLDKNDAKLYTYFSVSENSQTLYGFDSIGQKDMFKKLISVSGIGPKVGMSILSTLTTSQLAAAIISSDISAFEPVSGVGKKTAQRIVLELREKVSNETIIDSGFENFSEQANPQMEAINALVSLGYDRNTAQKAISQVKNLGDSTEDLILLALKRLG